MNSPKTISSWMNPKLEARNIEGMGRGVYARESILKGEKLTIFGGNIMLISEEPTLNEVHSDFALQIDESFVIGPRFTHEVEDTDFFNHSCNPNAGIKGQIILVAIRNIEPDEEITFDYAMVLHPTQGCPRYEFECSCNSHDCRGKVTENVWNIPELQRRYDGLFSIYLQEKIDQLKR
jgi:uncharacterized protein